MLSGSIERTLLGPDGRSLQIRRTPEGLFYFEEIQIVTPDEEEVRITGRAEPYQNHLGRSGLYGSLAEAETDARRTIDWLKD